MQKALDDANGKGPKLRFHDQDILNQMLDGHSIYLPKKYNYIYSLCFRSFFQKQPHNDDWKQQTILHFADHAKPWHSWVQHWDVAKAYADLRKASPRKDLPLVPPNGTKNLHQAARTARMQGRYGEALAWYGKYLASKL